jgi:L-rhamnose mutarotase
MLRQVFLLDLREETVAAAYEAHHRPGGIPRGVLEDIMGAGVASMQIYRLGTRLVMITESDEEANAASRVGSQASREWEELMDSYQRPIPGGPQSEKWRSAELIFDLSEHHKKEN